MDSPQHGKFEWDVTHPQPDDSPRPLSTTDTASTGESTITLENHNDHLHPRKPCNQRLVPQIAELALTPQVSRISRAEVTRVATNTSTWTTDPAYEIDWEDGDPDDPRNWPLWYKSIVIFSISFGTLVV